MKFLGALRHACGTDTLNFKCGNGRSVYDLVNIITAQAPILRKNLIDEHLEPPKANALILVNGKEISVLKGLDTIVKDGDEVVFVPFMHGG